MEQAKATGIVGWIQRLGQKIGTLFSAKRKSPSLDPETQRRLHGRLLRLAMRDLCEKYYGTVWISGWEASLWAMAQNTKKEDGVLLLYLAEQCSGWWVWDDMARAEVLIPLDAWKRNYSADDAMEPVE
jgi:hypothetical protein